MQKNKILISTLVILVVIAASLGATYAWFTAQSDPIENVFTAGTVMIEADETLVAEGFSKDNWNPGDCAEKQFTIINTGSKRIALRGLVELKWEEFVNGEWVPWTQYDDGEDSDYYWLGAAKFKMCDGTDSEFEFDPDDWIIEYDENEGVYYIYYNGDIPGTFVEQGDSPSVEDRTVKFCLNVCLDGPQADNDYQGKRFTLTATFQAIQASHDDEWEWDNIDFETGLELPAATTPGDGL